MIRLSEIMGQLARGAPPAPAPAEGVVARPFDALQRFLAELRGLPSGTRPAWDELERLLGVVVDALGASGDLLWVAHRRPATPDVDYLAFHQARTSILAVRLGMELGEPRERLIALGAAGCLFDVALWKLSGAAAGDWSEGSPAWREHPRRSADIVAGWSVPLSGVVEAILLHHERERGQGFPRGLTGEAIPLHAKIVGLADTYARLTVPPAWLAPRAPHHAIRDLVRARHETFPAPVVKALVDVVSIFPPGTRVRLSTGEVGRVVGVNPRQPLRPHVEVVTDTRGHPAPPRVVDLRESPFIFITGPAEEDA